MRTIPPRLCRNRSWIRQKGWLSRSWAPGRALPLDVEFDLVLVFSLRELYVVNVCVLRVVFAEHLRALDEAVQRCFQEFKEASADSGGWSQKEYDKFEAAVADCERIDAEAWKACLSYDSHFDHVGGLIRLAP